MSKIVRLPVMAALVAALTLVISAGTTLAANTKHYTEKEGFERKQIDIINTLKDNEVTRFMTLRDGLVQAFDLDKTVKNKGPFTMLAISDDAFKRFPADDLSSLFSNKKKLRQVLEYCIIDGKFSSSDLLNKKKVKTMEGSEVTFSKVGDNIFADKALIKVTDIPCSNGVIHVLDAVIMPTLKK